MKINRITILALLGLSTLNPQLSTLLAQGPAFTYQGRFNTNDAPYTGPAEFQFTLWDAASGGNAVATNNPAAVIAAVIDGLFTVTLDFGVSPFNGQPRFLQIEARTAIGPFTTLSPRQPITTTPYAVRAANFSGAIADGQLSANVARLNAAQIFSGANTFSGANSFTGGNTFRGNGAGLTGLDASQLTSGTVPNTRLLGSYGNALTFNNAGNSFVGEGRGLTALSASQLASGTVPDGRLGANVARTNQVWLLEGNVETKTGTHFLGTTDDEPLELKVNNVRALRIEPNTNGAPNMVAGSPRNVVEPGVVGATIAGGGAVNYFVSGVALTNRIASDFGAISGGADNSIQTNAGFSTIGGGRENEIRSGSSHAIIAGGDRNTIGTNSDNAFIGSGIANSVQNSRYGVIGSGFGNDMLSQSGGFIGGGSINQLGGTSLGGSSSLGTNTHNAIVGGAENWIAAGAAYGFIGGGRENFIAQGVLCATVPGGRNNRADGDYSFAAGRNARASHDGTFVWGDSSSATIASTSSNQFIVRARGGIWFGTNSSPSVPAGRFINTSTGGFLSTGGAWTDSSDRNVKENFQPVDRKEILERVARLPIATWNYKAEDSSVRHIGPVAQDFYAGFGVGQDAQHIARLDANGVALAAIQGLNQKLTEELKRRDAENAELKDRLTALEKLIAGLDSKGTEP